MQELSHFENGMKIHMDSAVSKRVSNIYYILAYLFHSISRQFCEVWAMKFPFLYNFKDNVLVILTIVATSTGLWVQLSKNMHLACPSLQPL